MTLYMVTRSPRARYRSSHGGIYWFTHACSKAQALRAAATLLPDDFGPDPSRTYANPAAEPVLAGGPAKYL